MRQRRMPQGSSVAAGVRRIEAITGRAVEEMMDKQQDLVADLRALFNNVPDLMGTIQRAINENADLRKQLDDFKAQKAQQYKQELIANAREVAGVKVISGVVNLDPQVAKDMVFQLRGQFAEGSDFGFWRIYSWI